MILTVVSCFLFFAAGCTPNGPSQLIKKMTKKGYYIEAELYKEGELSDMFEFDEATVITVVNMNNEDIMLGAIYFKTKEEAEIAGRLFGEPEEGWMTAVDGRWLITTNSYILYKAFYS